MASDGSRRGSRIGYGQFSGEQRTTWREEVGLVSGKDMGDAQVGGLYFTEARREVSADRAGCRISFLGKSNNGRGGQGGK